MATESSRPAAPPPLPGAALPAFLAELAGKSDLVWVEADGSTARPMWSVWHDECITVVTGGLEQSNPGLTDGSNVTVILRSKENRARQATVRATVEQLVPGSESWDAAVAVLHPQRLNAPDGEGQPARWATESTVWRLHLTDQLLEQPGSYSDSSLRTEPLATDATTLTRKPYHAGRATKKRR